MRRFAALTLACLAALAAAGNAGASHLPCGLPQAHPLFAEFSDGSVGFRQQLFGRPGVVVATNGVERAAEMRSLGARTVYWHMFLKGLAGLPTAPNPPELVDERIDALIERARASTGCETPPIALNELWGVSRPTPWPVEVQQYRRNVLTVLRELAASGAQPFLLVPGTPRGRSAPFTGGDAAAWWLEVAKVAHVVRQVHFNGRLNYLQGPIVGPRLRRVAMRDSLRPFLELGIPAERLGLLVGFQSGPGKGGREGLRPSAAWFQIVKREALAAKQVIGELGIGSVWSWGWGTFNVEGADPDKPRAACVWLWARDPSLCNGPAVAGRRFDPSLTEGRIDLPAGVQCTTPLGQIRTGAVDALAPAAGGRTAALSALLSRLVLARHGGPVSQADLDRAEAAVVGRAFGGDSAAFEAELAARGLARGTARAILADHFREQAISAAVLVRFPGRYAPDWLAARYKAALRGAICVRDEVPGPRAHDWGAEYAFLELPDAAVSIEARRRRGLAVVLSGRVQSLRARETVEVYARRAHQGAFWRIGTARVGAGGRWTLTVAPAGRTFYRALASSAVSETIQVRA